MDRNEGAFLIRETQDISLDGEVWGIEQKTVEGGFKRYGIAGADGQAERARKEAEDARAAAETERAEDEAARAQAEDARAAAEAERVAQQAKNNADQAANNAAAQGLQVVKLNDGQYDPSTLMPTVQGEVGKLYFVPIPSQAMGAIAALADVPAGDGQDNYLEWMSIDGKWERVGMSNATLVSLTTDEIDRIAAGGQVTSESVLDGTKLTYLWAKLKTAFAALTHNHATGDVTGLDAALADKATKGELKTVQDSLSRLADYRFERLWSDGNQRVDFESSCGIATVSWTLKFDGITSWRLAVPEYVRAEHASYFPAALVRSDNTPIDHVAYVLLNSTSNYMQFFAASATASNVWHEGCISYHLKRS